MGRRPSIILNSGLPPDYIPEYPWFDQATAEIRARMRSFGPRLLSSTSLQGETLKATYQPPISMREAKVALIQGMVLLEESADAWPEGEEELVDFYLARAQAALESIKKRNEKKAQGPGLRLVK